MLVLIKVMIFAFSPFKEAEKEMRQRSGDLNLAKPEVSTKPSTLRCLPTTLALLPPHFF